MKKRKLDFEDNTGEKEIRWEQRIGSLLSGTSGLSFHHWASTLCLQTLFSTSIFILEIQSIPHFVCVCCRFHICQFAKLMSIESVIPPNSLILSHTLLLLPSIFSSFRVFSGELALPIRWTKYWSFSFSTSLLLRILQWDTLCPAPGGLTLPPHSGLERLHSLD